ncbi:MAG: hypothetical protein ABI556_00660 [Gemmatimonadales bacterium]
MTIRLRILVALCMLCIAQSVRAQNLSADEIVARHLEARGGAARLKALQTVVYSRGKYREPGFEGSGNAFMAMARPYHKIVSDPTDTSSTFREGYDGSAWEWYRSPGIVVRTVGAANAAIRHNIDVDGPLSDYELKGTTIERLADLSIDGHPAYGLKVTLRDGFQTAYFLDKSSYLVVATRQSSPIHAFGVDVTTESRNGDYRRVGGILFSFSSRDVEIATNKEQSSMVWGNIETDRVLPPEWFAPPQFTRTTLQSFLEKLYYERADTSAVQWSYRAFRHAHPEIDTREGVESIGYQILKMNDHAGAIAILSLNARDYPSSSTSAFGLGRAYRTAGDIDKAKSEFSRALSLDPSNKRATDALAAISR